MLLPRPTKAPLPSLIPNNLPREDPSALIAGVDEAGRGPWAGPVVAAAVIVRRPFDVRIDDSKRLSPLQRLKAFEAIRRHAGVGVGIVDAPAIDKINILQATLLAMRFAVGNLPVTPTRVLVDGMHVPQIAVPSEAIIGGDHLNYAISCASIIAKVIRDDLMAFYHRIFPQYRFDVHKGYGTALHRQLLMEHGPCALHRMSFEPIASLSACVRKEGEYAGSV